MWRKLVTKKLLGRADGSLFSSINLRLCLALVVCVLQIPEATACWKVLGFSGESKFDASLARVSIVLLLGAPQRLGIHKTISQPFVTNWLISSFVLFTAE